MHARSRAHTNTARLRLNHSVPGQPAHRLVAKLARHIEPQLPPKHPPARHTAAHHTAPHNTIPCRSRSSSPRRSTACRTTGNWSRPIPSRTPGEHGKSRGGRGRGRGYFVTPLLETTQCRCFPFTPSDHEELPPLLKYHGPQKLGRRELRKKKSDIHTKYVSK